MNKEMFFEYWFNHGLFVKKNDGQFEYFAGRELWEYTADMVELEGRPEFYHDR